MPSAIRSIASFGFPVSLMVLMLMALAGTGCSSDSGFLPWNNSTTAGLSPSHMPVDTDTQLSREEQRYLQSIYNERRWYAQKWLESARLPEPKRTYMRQKLLAMEKESVLELERTLQETERPGQSDAVNDLTGAINTTVVPGRTIPSVAPSF